MEKGFTYIAPLQKSNNMQFDSSAWKKAIKLSEKGKNKDSIKELLKYADRKIKKKRVSEGVYKIPHGSVFVDIDFSGDTLKISADFLDISEANKIPLFRKVTELNFSALNLSQIKLYDDALKFEYVCPMKLYDPYKIWDVMAEICYFSDKYDEEFSEKFGAKNIVEGKITHLSDKQKDKIYDIFKLILQEAFEFIEHLESKRMHYYVWDVLSITLKRITTSCQPNGSLAVRIVDEINNLYSKELSAQDIAYKGKEFLKELDNMEKEEFTKNLFIADEFIPRKKVASEEDISKYLQPGYADASQDLQSGNFMSSYLIFTHIMYNALHYHIMPFGMEKAIRKKLKSFSKMKIEKGYISNFSLSILELVNLQNIPSSRTGFWAIIWGIFMFILGLFLGQ